MKIPVKIPVNQQIPAGTGTGIKRPNPGRDPGRPLAQVLLLRCYCSGAGCYCHDVSARVLMPWCF